MVNFTNHFLGFVSCSDSAKIVGFFGFLIASLPQTKIVLEVFVKALGKNQKKIPFHCKTTERVEGLVVYLLFTITIFYTEILTIQRSVGIFSLTPMSEKICKLILQVGRT